MEAFDRLERHWRWWLLLFWLIAVALMLYDRRYSIQAFALGDTDDNMRMMQVRGLLEGQGWYDLRQYRLNPPAGADIHWSRLVDLPIAGLKLLLAPLMGGAAAERAAVALAPMIPLAVAMGAVAVTVRRLVAPQAFALAIAILFCAHSARGMWSPLRIDHHGWQLAALALAMAGLTDPKKSRGGFILGAASALSFAIGLEMLLYLALAGGALVLMWVRDSSGGRGLAVYGASLAGGCALGFLIFASYANRAPVCDALSPVWLSTLAAAGALAVLLAATAAQRWQIRLAAAGACGILLAAAFAYAWPHCIGRLEGASPELERLWLDNVREARPLYTHGFHTAVAIASLPFAGLIGYALMLWRDRRDEALLVPWAAVSALAALSFALLFWQSRAGPASQLLAVPGATALGWLLVPRVRSSRAMIIRVVGTVLAFMLISGLLTQQLARLVPQKAQGKGMKAVNKANGLCPTMAALGPVARVPRGLVLTFVDLGPRLITVTDHDAIAGPYHRNGKDIIDVQHAFRGTSAQALEIVERRRVDYVLICPGLSESTIYASQAKTGFYMQLARGQIPPWLTPVPLPAKSPYRMWRVVRAAGPVEVGVKR